MIKKIVSIVELSTLHDILIEVNSLFSFKVFNFLNTEDFLKEIKDKGSEVLSSIVISKKNNSQLLNCNKIDINNLILLEENPIKIGQLLDRINILLIKKKYNFQSQLNIKSYTLNLNSRIISQQEDELKLTEREIDVILFLKEKETPQSVESLQNKVWKYSNTLETHTVETHIYRLRKKFKKTFNDSNFILSLKEGYKI